MVSACICLGRWMFRQHHRADAFSAAGQRSNHRVFIFGIDRATKVRCFEIRSLIERPDGRITQRPRLPPTRLPRRLRVSFVRPSPFVVEYDVVAATKFAVLVTNQGDVPRPRQ